MGTTYVMPLVRVQSPSWSIAGGGQIFVDSGLEKANLIAEVDLANNMGQFLQKTNVIRDYLEDINEEPAPR